VATSAPSTGALPGGLPTFTGAKLWLSAFVLALSNFIVVLDMTVANVSIPHIAGDLGVSMDQGTWIITTYAVA
jgi:MFS transporter, DHA2 family, multidrug resistance protein